ncbi:MAG: thioredoxin family protein [Candidatus Bathyarchaeota archaeon]|jgi:thiol-disulfide isomerase/thioredoxin|nr:thioredoxin family protein [Candidatus Bathyarchaeota archaeon]
MPIKTIEFTDLEKELLATKKRFQEALAPELGKAYIIAITRDGCPACERQKPKLDQLAKAAARTHKDRVVFTRIHVKYRKDMEKESARSKEVLAHYFYPTNLILVRTKDRGATELYRSAAPTMSELKRHIGIAVKLAEMLKSRG